MKYKRFIKYKLFVLLNVEMLGKKKATKVSLYEFMKILLQN